MASKNLTRTALALVVIAVITGITVVILQISQQPDPKPHDWLPLPWSISESTEAMIYFTQARGSEPHLQAVVRAIPEEVLKTNTAKQPDLSISSSRLTFVLNALLQGPTSEEALRGLYSEIPTGTRLLGIHQNNHTIRINLSKEFTLGGGVTSMQQRLGELVQTILATEHTIPVYLDIEGEELQILGGEGILVPEPLHSTVNAPQ